MCHRRRPGVGGPVDPVGVLRKKSAFNGCWSATEAEPMQLMLDATN